MEGNDTMRNRIGEHRGANCEQDNKYTETRAKSLLTLRWASKLHRFIEKKK